MLFFSRSKILMILGAVLLGLLFAAPNAMKSDIRNNMPATFQRTINLGLDLQGGVQMKLAVDLSTIIDPWWRSDNKSRTGVRESHHG